MLEHPDFAAHVEAIARPRHGKATATTADAAGTPDGYALIYSGGITSVDDIATLARFNIEGAISGTALYDGSIDLPRRSSPSSPVTARSPRIARAAP